MSNPTPIERRDAANIMLSHLQAALHAGREAGCKQTIPRIRHALSSAKGAVRNAQCRVSRYL